MDTARYLRAGIRAGTMFLKGLTILGRYKMASVA